jgi:hypothetical protein
MSRQDQGRIRVRRGRVSVEIMTALDNTWNNGQICHSCIVDVVFAYGEHSRDVYKLVDDHVLTFFPADPNVEVLEAVKRRNLELLTRAEAAERQIVANEARITELTRLKDELAEDASRERQRAEAAEARVVNWISAEDRLPETQLRVLAVMLYDGRKPRIIRAMHIPAKTVECLDWEFNDAVVYDSESERHYFGAGWYELMEEGEYDYVGPLSDSVTHWAEMPELPEYFRQ